MSHHIVDFIDISYTYPDGNKVLEDVSIRIHHGEAVALVGANGAGKSTMLKLLVGILIPEHGEIRLGELPVTKKTMNHIRQEMDIPSRILKTSFFPAVFMMMWLLVQEIMDWRKRKCAKG
jgi:ABC-type bacteriocin/lantibiotic exporter with double-glycine peptidase domain